MISDPAIRPMGDDSLIGSAHIAVHPRCFRGTPEKLVTAFGRFRVYWLKETAAVVIVAPLMSRIKWGNARLRSASHNRDVLSAVIVVNSGETIHSEFPSIGEEFTSSARFGP